MASIFDSGVAVSDANHLYWRSIPLQTQSIDFGGLFIARLNVFPSDPILDSQVENSGADVSTLDIRTNNEVSLSLSGPGSPDDFTPAAEQTIRLGIKHGSLEISSQVQNDTSNPYEWTGNADVGAMATAIRASVATETVVVIFDTESGSPIDLDTLSIGEDRTGDGDGATVSVVGNEGEGRAVAPLVDRVGDGDGAVVTTTGNEGEGEASATVAALTLADFDDTGLDVDAAALLVASAPGTTGNDIYADSDRGGTDTPLDGEIAISSNDTLISRIRRISDTVLVLNDNNNPGVLDLNTYFGTGGDGADLTLSLQTIADGLVSFAVADQLVNSGANFAQFTLPADAQTLLDNLATDDRWIFALARAATVDVAPSFTDSTGDDQSWIQNTAITDITVPTASGTPTPTYAVEGSTTSGDSLRHVHKGYQQAHQRRQATARSPFAPRTRRAMRTGRLTIRPAPSRPDHRHFRPSLTRTARSARRSHSTYPMQRAATCQSPTRSRERRRQA